MSKEREGEAVPMNRRDLLRMLAAGAGAAAWTASCTPNRREGGPVILDRLDQAQRYESLHPRFAAAFAFLRQKGLADLADGEYPIDDRRVYAIVSHVQGRGKALSPLEAHRRYIDIQFIVSGREVMGWQRTAECTRVQQAYDPQKDIGFFSDPPARWFAVPPGSFVIFHPDDAHAPLAGEGPLHKVVVKVEALHMRPFCP